MINQYGIMLSHLIDNNYYNFKGYILNYFKANKNKFIFVAIQYMFFFALVKIINAKNVRYLKVLQNFSFYFK